MLNLDTAAVDKLSDRASMPAREYRAQLLGLIEDAGNFLSDAESLAVLTEAFNLLYTRLGVKIRTEVHISSGTSLSGSQICSSRKERIIQNPDTLKAMGKI